MYRDFIVLQVDGISIVGQLLLPDEKARYRLVCLCHGAPSGSPPEPGDGGYPALAERFCREGFAACFFNFRGAGDSGGNLDFLGWTRDLQAVVDRLRPSSTVTVTSAPSGTTAFLRPSTDGSTISSRLLPLTMWPGLLPGLYCSFTAATMRQCPLTMPTVCTKKPGVPGNW